MYVDSGKGAGNMQKKRKTTFRNLAIRSHVACLTFSEDMTKVLDIQTIKHDKKIIKHKPKNVIL